MMLWMFLRVCVISASTGVPRIGKNRIRCSGGGSTVISLMRSSSVWLVLSTGFAYQVSLAVVGLAFIRALSVPMDSGKKKPPGVRRFSGEFGRVALGTLR